MVALYSIKATNETPSDPSATAATFELLVCGARRCLWPLPDCVGPEERRGGMTWRCPSGRTRVRVCFICGHSVCPRNVAQEIPNTFVYQIIYIYTSINAFGHLSLLHTRHIHRYEALRAKISDPTHPVKSLMLVCSAES